VLWSLASDTEIPKDVAEVIGCNLHSEYIIHAESLEQELSELAIQSWEGIFSLAILES
jgi:hypothetical protein